MPLTLQTSVMLSIAEKQLSKQKRRKLPFKMPVPAMAITAETAVVYPVETPSF
jgi:hypothetical protein